MKKLILFLIALFLSIEVSAATWKVSIKIKDETSQTELQNAIDFNLKKYDKNKTIDYEKYLNDYCIQKINDIINNYRFQTYQVQVSTDTAIPQ